MIIDTHLHLDDAFDGTAQGAVQELHRQMEAANVTKAIVLHLEIQPWSAEEVAEALLLSSKLYGFINVHPYSEDAALQLRAGIEKLGYIGLKLHPRLQGFDVDDSRTVQLVNIAGEMGVPVLVDAFPDGTHILQGFSPVKYACLAKKCPNTKIIIAHMGGHYVIDFMMLAKRIPNMYFDFSYSLLYYQSSTIPIDMVYAMRSMKFNRVFYGSDYPDRTISSSLEMSIKFLQSQELEREQLDKIMFRNAQEFFGWD